MGRAEQAHTSDHPPCWHSLGLLQILLSRAATVAEGSIGETLHTSACEIGAECLVP